MEGLCPIGHEPTGSIVTVRLIRRECGEDEFIHRFAYPSHGWQQLERIHPPPHVALTYPTCT